MVWHRDKSFEFKDCLTVWGISDTPEEALARVEHTLRHGRSNPPQTANEVRKMFAGGVFHVYSTHMALPVPRIALEGDQEVIQRLGRHALALNAGRR